MDDGEDTEDGKRLKRNRFEGYKKVKHQITNNRGQEKEKREKEVVEEIKEDIGRGRQN